MRIFEVGIFHTNEHEILSEALDSYALKPESAHLEALNTVERDDE